MTFYTLLIGLNWINPFLIKINKLSKWTYWVNGWDLKIEVMNGAGNLFERTRNVDGAISSIWQIASYFASFATWIWDQVTSALRTAAAAVVELTNALEAWVKAQISAIFNAVVDPIISGLTSWAEGIEYHMTQFFSELAKWDTLNGDESVSATMNAGSAFMLSFMGQQDKAEQITDVLMYVMNFIEPFQKYLSPFGAIGVISSVFGAEIDEGDSGLSNIFNILSNGIEGGCQQAWDLISGSDSPISQYLSSNIGSASLNLPSIQSVKNFYSELDLNNPFLEGIIDFLPDGADETNTVGDGLLFFFGFSAIAMAFSPAGEIAATFTLQGLSILFNIIGIATQGWTSAMMGYGSMVTGFLSEVAFHASTNQVNPASLLILAISPTIGLSIGALRTAQVIGDE